MALTDEPARVTERKQEMAAELDHTSIVVLGVWNQAIISPAWLHKQGIVTKLPSGVEATYDLPTKTIGFSIPEDVQWQIRSDRIVVKRSSLRNCGTYVSGVLDKLTHTPIRAVGTNFVWKLPAADCLQLPGGSQLTVPVTANGLTFSQVQWQGQTDLDSETVLNVVANREQGGCVVSLNLHRNCDSAAKARTFARRWRGDRDRAVELLRIIFGVETS